MISSRIVSFFLVFLTLGFLTYAKPVTGADVERRQEADSIEAVFSNLQASASTILPQIDSLVDSGEASDENVAPLLEQLQSAFDAANTDMTAFTLKGGDKKSHNKDELAKVIAGIVITVTKTLDKVLLTGAKLPIVGGILVKLEITINKLLLGVELLLAGVLKLVAVLLVDVAGLLKSIGFGLLLATFGL
ncbi:sc15 protein [Moniliophthora roreri MCA 2997]|uniref:Sc15 protein n=2 Tax=Moniliophthora roreri TaxID=221103 RepID=V2YHG9_MONRO|nr:sc15 protein [Moniliophthora roreri MCA 2997]KAI3616809.1 sc15 protein [Moniliophthora roreri]